VKGAEVYRCTVNLLLNPTNIMCVSSNDPDFIELEKLSKVLLPAGLIPSEQAIDNPAHCFEVHIARESEVLIGRCQKLDVPRGSFQFTRRVAQIPDRGSNGVCPASRGVRDAAIRRRRTFWGLWLRTLSHLSKTAKGGASPRWAARRRSTKIAG
jgi:hypothetical protein